MRHGLDSPTATASIPAGLWGRGDLTGRDGLLKESTKTVIETALAEEMSEYLGYDKRAPEGRNRGNSCNGKRTKTVLTDACSEVDIDVP